MKKTIILLIILVQIVSNSFAQTGEAIKGTWMNEEKTAKVEIFKTGDKYMGKLVWTKDMYEADGKTLKKDSRNEDENLRNRTIINLVILTNFQFDDGEWINGKIYDPKNGKTYKSKMKLNNGNLEIRGYIGSPAFGKTTSWTKVS